MSDLFHPKVPLEFIRQVFTVMTETPRHTYQILTKRSQRLAALAPRLDWPNNVWKGVSVENARYAFRIDHLGTVPAAIRFVSAEPLLGPLADLDLTGIHWLIVGGESGSRARPMQESWALDLRDQCATADVAFFFKQWGGPTSKSGGRLLQRVLYNEMPGKDSRSTQRELDRVSSEADGRSGHVGSRGCAPLQTSSRFARSTTSRSWW